MSLNTIPLDIIQIIMMLCDIDSLINLYCTNNNYAKYINGILKILAIRWKLSPKYTFPELVKLYDRKKITYRSYKYLSLRICTARAASIGNRKLFYYYYNKYKFDTEPTLYLLIRSMSSADPEIINHIISRNMNPNLLGKYGLSRLFIKASKSGNINLIKALCGEKQELEIYNFHNINDFLPSNEKYFIRHCIWNALKYGHIDLYNWFMGGFIHKIAINDMDKLAARRGDIALLQKMDFIDYKIIILAAKHNHHDTVKYLIDRNMKELSEQPVGLEIGEIEFSIVCEKIFDKYEEIIRQLSGKYGYNIDKILTTYYISKGLFDKVNYYENEFKAIRIMDAIRYKQNKKAIEWLKYELYQNELADWEYNDIIEDSIRYKNYEIIKFFAATSKYRISILKYGVFLQNFKTVEIIFNEFPINITC
jgi:hypothetical protein